MVPATLLYIGWTVLAVYVNLNAGVGKPLWEITLDEFSLWFKVMGQTLPCPFQEPQVTLSLHI
ncbi:hypothetical protein PG996_000151 [Apiospora saccharicola]|uniref:Uncharacterized protein n=1 Tax=Apiospora saccharicola TaxID=335842 RepID=A0ABR1WCX6_9PEZI